MGRQPCCDKIGLKRGPWTVDEDQKLMNFILNNGIHCWRLVPKMAGLLRCGKSCRLRWTNYLRPDLKRGALTEMEENLIIQLHSSLGNRWSKIAAHLPGRTDNEIKNHWNTRIKKRLKLLGVDPVTHKPIEQAEKCEPKGSKSSNLSQLTPREEQENDLMVSSMDNHCQKHLAVLKQERFELGLDETGNQMNGYSMLWESLDTEEMKLQINNNNIHCSSCTTSFSLEDTFYPTVGDFSSLMQESKSQSGDSFSSWDEFHPLEEIFSMGNHQ